MLWEFSLVPQAEERLKTWSSDREDAKETADWGFTWWVTRSTVQTVVYG